MEGEGALYGEGGGKIWGRVALRVAVPDVRISAARTWAEFFCGGILSILGMMGEMGKGKLFWGTWVLGMMALGKGMHLRVGGILGWCFGFHVRPPHVGVDVLMHPVMRAL